VLLPILKYGAEPLRRPTHAVDFFNSELEKIARNMVETMYSAPGIGLAANQVGIELQLATIDLTVGEDSKQLIVLCNPEVVRSEGEQKSDEGCLSIPDFTETIVRPSKMTVMGQDVHGNEIEFEAEGLLARCVSHEIDHLNGVLFIDHLSPLKRNLIRNKIKKLARTGEW